VPPMTNFLRQTTTAAAAAAMPVDITYFQTTGEEIW